MLPISVIIPVYNHERYIEQCLRSIAESARRPREIVLIDNASTDASVARAKALGLDNLVVLRNDTNLGATRARNIAVRRSRCDLLAFLDSDDFFGPDALGQAYDTMLRHDLDLSLFTTVRVSEDGGTVTPFIVAPAEVINGRDAFALTLGRWQIHANMLMKKSVYLQAADAFTAHGHSDDELLSRELFLRADRVMGSDGVYHYRYVGKVPTVADVIGQIRTNVRVLDLAWARRASLVGDGPLREMRNVVVRNLAGLAAKSSRGRGDWAALGELHRAVGRLPIRWAAEDLRFRVMNMAVAAALLARGPRVGRG